MRTSAVQRTLDPLKSSLSSFSTATFRSAAVSNSTNLSHVNGIVPDRETKDLTLYHRGRGRPRRRPHQGLGGAQSLLDPMVPSKSESSPDRARQAASIRQEATAHKGLPSGKRQIPSVVGEQIHHKAEESYRRKRQSDLKEENEASQAMEFTVTDPAPRP